MCTLTVLSPSADLVTVSRTSSYSPDCTGRTRDRQQKRHSRWPTRHTGRRTTVDTAHGTAVLHAGHTATVSERRSGWPLQSREAGTREDRTYRATASALNRKHIRTLQSISNEATRDECACTAIDRDSPGDHEAQPNDPVDAAEADVAFGIVLLPAVQSSGIGW